MSFTLLVAFALAASFHVAFASMELNGWFECSSFTFADSMHTTRKQQVAFGNYTATNASALPVAECAIFQAPLCHDGVCAASNESTIDIFVKRILSPQGESNGFPNVFFMQGGPGAASPAMETAMLSLFGLLQGNVNVYTMDHRGTGRSTKLDCVAAQAQTSGSPSHSTVSVEEVPNCAVELQARYGGDLVAFSTTSAAWDLHTFITQELHGSKTFVYGVSYGTSLVERLMHLNTTEIVGYVLDGIATTSGSNVEHFEYASNRDFDYDQVGEYVLSQCEAHPEDCGQYFRNNSLSVELKSLLLSLDNGSSKCTSFLQTSLAAFSGSPPSAVAPGDALRTLLGSLLADATLRTLIPVLTYRLRRCGDQDEAVLGHFFSMLSGILSQRSEDMAFMSDLEFKLIVYSEMWELPSPSTDDLKRRFLNSSMSTGVYADIDTYCACTKANVSACQPYTSFASYDAAPIVYRRDQYWNVAASPSNHASVLLLSSKMDPQTPHKFSAALYAALKTERKKLVVFEHATHGTLFTTRMAHTPNAPVCGMSLLASYVSSQGDLDAMDTSCVSAMPAMSFQVPPPLVSRWFNTTSAYDGVFLGNQSVPTHASDTSTRHAVDAVYKTLFLVFLALSVVLGVVALVQWRRLIRRSTKSFVMTP
ncbi:hypothetical protein Poli38472_011054 [Pythium oligandrum]|uniref:Peptidase S33 tripeptidyl aminopeptidase-like C-terminal domain-containing protein n=1 Tax=Pythium oligandrum TaxID=41045 RepID=A0A8K1CPW3_PYTOL|nr:hypothetical protein Poli38472_011054 [Pythium oligandrum]|eukprot:TMW67434.1 hypothetical protein Poli38472_011054 [Pythium oligandrum]